MDEKKISALINIIIVFYITRNTFLKLIFYTYLPLFFSFTAKNSSFSAVQNTLLLYIL